MSYKVISLLDVVPNGSIVALHARFENRSVPQNQYARCSNKPEERSEGTSPPEHGNSNGEEPSIEVLLGDRVFADLGCFRS